MIDKLKKTERFVIFNKFWVFAKPLKKKLYSIGFFKIYFMIFTLITPIFYKILIDNIMLGGNISILPLVIFGYVGVYSLQTLGIVFEKRSETSFLMPFALKIRISIFKKYINMENIEYEKYSVGDLKTILDDDVNKVRGFIIEHVIGFLFSIINVFVIGIIMMYVNFWLALFGFVMVPLSFLFTKVMGKKAQKISELYRQEYGKYQTFLHGSLQNWKEIKSNNLELNEEKTMKKYWDKLTPLFIKNQIFWYINRGFIAFKNLFITKMNIYFIGGLFIINNQMTVGTLLIFMTYYEEFFGHISKLSELHMVLKNDIPSLNRIFEILESTPNTKKFSKTLGETISVQNVSFSYTQNIKALDNISFSINKGEKVAIVGKSGCGKSTIVKLLTGIYTANSGKIKFGNEDISFVNQKSINNIISCVMQEPLLFNLSIRENLTLVKKNVTEKELVFVCEQSDIYSFIRELPNGFDTIIGERGIKLSGGQKQRLAIARVLLLNPKIIVFDEATSALDNKNEKAIVDSIANLSVDKTVIIIAHRLSSVINSDKVIVMDNGKIVATGTHDSLKGNNKTYDLLFEKQYV